MTMRILHVIESLAPRRGGPVTVLKSLACQQARATHDVTILTTNQDYPTGTLAPAGLATICAGTVKVIYCSSEYPPLNLSLGLAQYIRHNARNFDILHIHGLYRFPSTYSAYIARQQNVPHVIRPHGAIDPFLHKQSARNLVLKRLWERWFDLPNLHGAGAIHYTAEDEREFAAFLQLRAPSFIAPNGIDWDLFEKLPNRGQFRASLGIGNAPLVLFLGRLHHKKGLDILIPAFDKVRREIPDARLAIVGPDNDNYSQQVTRWVRERGLEKDVIRVEFLAGVDVIQAYVDADVFALPSYTENFGMTVVESMACALPVIVSRNVNIHQDVTAAGAGIVTECDINEVAQSIVSLLREPEKRRQMGINGRRAAQGNYTWSRIVDKMTHEYSTVIDRYLQNKRNF